MADKVDALATSVDNLLSKLPANDNKTLAGLVLHAFLPVLVVNFPVLLVVAPALDALSAILVSVGVIHKVAKAVVAKKDEAA